ncbi:MAG: hypothetical protein IPJ03_18235 [Ignavibacteriales bacterium]|nr:hypothetical protein [Ignavibacteriales bacterium]
MKELKKNYEICSRGVWDATVPGITFDDNGVSNYALMFDKLCKAYPRGEKGKDTLSKTSEKRDSNIQRNLEMGKFRSSV